jgi:protein-tyrosine phosphatase
MPEAIQAGTGMGVDLSSHRSRLISADLLRDYSLILVMQSGHKEALSVEFPDLMSKVFLLSDVVGTVPYDIPDPYVTGEPPDEIAREIVDMIRAGWMKICKLATKLESGDTPS